MGIKEKQTTLDGAERCKWTRESKRGKTKKQKRNKLKVVAYKTSKSVGTVNYLLEELQVCWSISAVLGRGEEASWNKK